MINKVRCDLDRLAYRLRGKTVAHLLQRFGPAHFAQVVGSPVCADCAVAGDDDPLCQACMARYVNAHTHADVIVVCMAHEGKA